MAAAAGSSAFSNGMARNDPHEFLVGFVRNLPIGYSFQLFSLSLSAFLLGQLPSGKRQTIDRSPAQHFAQLRLQGRCNMRPTLPQSRVHISSSRKLSVELLGGRTHSMWPLPCTCITCHGQVRAAKLLNSFDLQLATFLCPTNGQNKLHSSIYENAHAKLILN